MVREQNRGLCLKQLLTEISLFLCLALEFRGKVLTFAWKMDAVFEMVVVIVQSAEVFSHIILKLGKR